MNVRSEGHEGMFSCGKQGGALAVLLCSPVLQQWEQHSSQPAAEGGGGHAGWGWRGQLLHLLQGRAKTTRCCQVPQPERCQASRAHARTAGHCRDGSSGPRSGFVHSTKEIKRVCLSLQPTGAGHACVWDWGEGKLPRQPGALESCFPGLAKSALWLGGRQVAQRGQEWFGVVLGEPQ